MLTFRNMTRDDIPLYLDWLEAPHVKQWWHSDGQKIYKKFDDPVYTDLLIVLWDDTPFGYLQVYDNTLTGDTHHPPGVRGMDLFIGDPAFLSKGLGQKILEAGAEKIFAETDAPYIIIDPQPDNEKAVRCYKAAGFKAGKIIQTKDGPALLMTLARPHSRHDRRGPQ